MSDLVERLRDYPNFPSHPIACGLIKEAAAALERMVSVDLLNQERRVSDALRAERDSFKSLYEKGCETWNPVYQEVLNERDALRSENERLKAKYVEAYAGRERNARAKYESEAILEAEIAALRSALEKAGNAILDAKIEELKDKMDDAFSVVHEALGDDGIWDKRSARSALTGEKDK